MKDKKPENSLIQAIERIYFRISLTVLHKRMNGYHKLSHKNIKPYASEIKASLLQCINDIVQLHKDDTELLQIIDDSIQVLASTRLHNNVMYEASSHHIVNPENVGELSRYFKERSYGADLHPSIEERLVHSTWEHIHAALRYARQNNMKNAKVHAEIANCACNELAHYLDEGRYQMLIAEIEKQLDSMKNSGGA